MEAFAIKGLYGIEVNTTRESAAECWSDWQRETELTSDVSEARGYRCVPVQVIEGWIPVSERLPKEWLNEMEWIAGTYDDSKSTGALASELYDVVCTAKRLVNEYKVHIAAVPKEPK